MNSMRTGKRRRRRAPAHYQVSASSAQLAAEERFLQQAIQNSKLEKVRGDVEVPLAPVFYPTIEDFQASPLQYVEKIRSIGEKYGIVKIVPPKGWNPGPTFGVDFESEKKFETKHQMLHRLQEGLSFGDGMDYNVKEYQTKASQRTKWWKAENYPDHDLLSRHTDTNAGNSSVDRKLFTPDNLERDYWDIVEMAKEVAVEYANDIDTHKFGSGFPLSERGRSIYGSKNLEKMYLPEPPFDTEDYYKETWWNLNNIPSAPDSVLRHVKVGINGINVPWLYHGSLFTTFCWHNEDNYLYSINYHHKGAPKQWYGVPGAKEAAEGLEKVFKSYLSMKMRDVPDLLHHITTMFSPRLLQNANVPVYKTLQHEGEFIITFPQAFHGGFSLGPNIGEAVNFATHDWIAYGAAASERYRSFARSAVFSHDRLTFTMANYLQDQTAYAPCKLLLDELERVVNEELRLRHQLQLDGVRDVSTQINLPKNCLDQLDERSANYDDKRLCHGCKHICFFSAVACECSQSKVSCLRHSHFMCRCPTNRKYFMIWSPDEELKETLGRVRQHCDTLRAHEADTGSEKPTAEAAVVPAEEKHQGEALEIAPGAARDLELHKTDGISTEPITRASFQSKTSTAVMLSPASQSTAPIESVGLATDVTSHSEKSAQTTPSASPIPSAGKSSEMGDRQENIVSKSSGMVDSVQVVETVLSSASQSTVRIVSGGSATDDTVDSEKSAQTTPSTSPCPSVSKSGEMGESEEKIGRKSKEMVDSKVQVAETMLSPGSQSTARIVSHP